MVEDSSLDRYGLDVLAKQWDLKLDPNLENQLQMLEQILCDRIAEMLQSDHSSLMNAFYRIDLDTTKVDRIIKNCSVNAIPLELAKLVIIREVEKAKSRQKYESQSDGD